MHVHPFGENTAWFAFKTTDVARVRELFRADTWREVGWEDGVDASYEEPDADGRAPLLVTPPIDGFVLVTSRGLLGWAPGGERILPELHREGEMSTRASEWASELDVEIQYYAAERDIDLYSWGRFRAGEDFDELDPYRELSHQMEELILSTGNISVEERALAEEFLRSNDCPRERIAAVRDELKRGLDAKQLVLADHAGVTLPAPELASPEALDTLAALLVGVRPDQVAASWSLDPNELDARSDAASIPATCWLGWLYL